MKKYLFIDTNTFLHFKSIEEIDWCQLFGIDSVVLIICSPVISELDKIKIFNNNSVIKKRAQHTLTLFNDIINASKLQEIRKNVNVTFWDKEPSERTFTENTLSSQITDDRILASMLEYDKDKKNNLILLTNDTGLLLKSRRLNIVSKPLPDEYIQAINDERDKELVVIKNELKSLKNSLPKLKILFENNKNTINFRNRKLKIPEDYVSKKIEELKKRFPHTTLQEVNSKINPFWRLLLNSQDIGIKQEEIDKYNDELINFYDSYKNYILEKLLYIAQRSLTYRIGLKLVNEGNALAKKIHIHFHFPDGFELFKHNYYSNKPEPPIPPKFSNSNNFSISLSDIESFINPLKNIPLHHNIDFSKLPKPNVSSFNIKKGNSYDVNCKVGELMHTYNTSLDDLFITFENYSELKSFNFVYEIIAENTPQPFEGKLNIIFNG